MTPTPSRSLSVDQQLHHVDLMTEVEVHGRLIEDEHAWRLGQGHGQHDQLSLAERQPPRIATDEVLDADPLDGGPDGTVVAVPKASEGVLMRDPAQRHDILDAGREGQADLARYDRHPARQRLAAVALERLAVEPDGPSPFRGVPGQDPQQARLAGAVRSQDRHALAGPDDQVDVVEDGARPVREPDPEQVEAVVRRAPDRQPACRRLRRTARRTLCVLEARGDHRQTS